MSEVINLDEKLGRFSAHWSPKIVGALNDYDIKVVKVAGDFVWHRHDDTDELFLVHRGRVNIQYRDRDNWVSAGEIFVVPRGVEHRPCADEECEIVLIEPRGIINTGDAGGALTNQAVWID